MKFLFTILILFQMFFVFSEEIIVTTDKLEFSGKYGEALSILKENLDVNNPDIRICWRIARNTFEISNNTNDKNKKIELFDEGINATKPYLQITNAEKRDRAELIHWYAANYASKIKLLGIFGGRESLTIVPEIFKLMDECLKIDPTYAGAYFFKAKLQGEVPFFLGGDKFEMANNYSLALKYAKGEKLIMLVDTAKALAARNWDIAKKTNKTGKSDAKDYAFNNMDDKEYSYNLLLEAKEFYEKKEAASEREKILYTEILKLLKEYDK